MGLNFLEKVWHLLPPADRVPYEWVPQIVQPRGKTIAPIDVTSFRYRGPQWVVPKPRLPLKVPYPINPLRCGA